MQPIEKRPQQRGNENAPDEDAKDAEDSKDTKMTLGDELLEREFERKRRAEDLIERHTLKKTKSNQKE